MRTTEIIVPASTSNLGASFDACGLALSLYLRVEVANRGGAFEVVPSGEGAERLPRDGTNLIVRVARSVAEFRGRKIDGARLMVRNEIPLARGLGSSSAAIIGGISVYEALAGDRLSEDELFSYALRFEDHGDNLAPSLLGGMVVACMVDHPAYLRTLVTVRREWPKELRVVLCIPEYEMDTAQMRDVLPKEVPLADAVFNIQRAALLQALISERRFDLFNEALRDRLHQPHRSQLGPGLDEVLRLNDETKEHPGLLGVSISGAGSTVIAFATENYSQIAGEMSYRLATAGIRSRTLEIEVDNRGRVVSSITPAV